jgi:hypothetical protein
MRCLESVLGYVEIESSRVIKLSTFNLCKTDKQKDRQTGNLFHSNKAYKPMMTYEKMTLSQYNYTSEI